MENIGIMHKTPQAPANNYYPESKSTKNAQRPSEI